MSLKLIAQSVWENPGNRGKRVRKSLAAVGWQLQKHLLGSTRLLTLPNGVRFRAYPDCVVSSALIYSDWPEYHELMFARSLLRPGDAVLDVEGYEKEVFRGSDALLRQDRPRLIMFESLEGGLDEEIRQFLAARSYVVFQLDEQGRPDPGRASNQNLFAVPEEQQGRIMEGKYAQR